MILNDRIQLLSKLGDYLLSENSEWQKAKQKAFFENGWFIPEFIDLATKNIADNFLRKEKLAAWVSHYARQPRESFAASPGAPVEDSSKEPRTVGIVMAGNIPLVGFHDFLSVFASGHKMAMKASSKDKILIKHLVDVLIAWEPKINEQVYFSEMLKNCDAYIATGSNNTSRYFEYYFGKYSHIIRRNKTSVAVLTGDETKDELEGLADDVYQFFGLGCRNVTKIYVPRKYGFETLLSLFKKYDYLADHHKYKNNYDYNLAIHMLNNDFYMTNGSIILFEDRSIFSPISQLNYEYYDDHGLLLSSLNDNEDVQGIVAEGHIRFGQTHSPTLLDYADKVDTMAFLHSLNP
jgi:Acyl-CoA reductase (LuxC)